MQAASDPTIPCPHCGKPIHLTEALARPLVDERIAAERQRITAEAQALAKASIGVELDKLRSENVSQKTALDGARKKELDVLQRERELIEKAESLELTVAKTLAAERDKITAAARASASSELGAELQRLRAAHDEQSQKLAQAQAAELAMRTEREAFETSQREWKLEKERQLEEERRRIRDAANREFVDAQRLKDAQQEKQLADLRAQITDLKHQAEKGSEQLIGEVQEVDLESNLRIAFPLDTIERVAKGLRGGDLLQRIAGPSGSVIASILWESKRTRLWDDRWLEKLREDQRTAKADLSILVTTALPRDVARFGLREGVWVTEIACSVAVASALRTGLVQVAAARATGVGRETKVELLYQYLCGPEFRARIEGIVEAFRTMKDDLDSERRATERQWAKREKQIERVLRSTSGMYGDLQGIAGSSIPELPSLAGPAEDVPEIRALADGATG